MENEKQEVNPNPSVQVQVRQKDYVLGMIAGFLIGLLSMPLLKNARADLYDQFFFLLVPFFLVAVPTGLYFAKIISKKIAVIWQLAKFVVIGGLNTVIDLGSLALLSIIFKNFLQVESTQIMISLFGGITFYSLFKAVSFIIANINSYFWNKYWTFEAKQKKSAAEMAQFFVVSLVGFAINVVIASYVFKAIEPFGGLNIQQWELVGAAVGSVAALTWNFIGYKFAVFRK